MRISSKRACVPGSAAWMAMAGKIESLVVGRRVQGGNAAERGDAHVFRRRGHFGADFGAQGFRSLRGETGFDALRRKFLSPAAPWRLRATLAK